MKAVGIGGSLKRGGLTERILTEVLDELSSAGHETEAVYIASEDIRGCRACLQCEKTGDCALAGDKTDEIINSVIPSANLVIVASPIYFTGLPWRLKALIDRVQVYWARRVRFDGGWLNRGISAAMLVGGSSPEKYFDGPALVLRSVLKELGYPCKWLGVLAGAEEPGADVESFIKNARRKIRALAEANAKIGLKKGT